MENYENNTEIAVVENENENEVETDTADGADNNSDKANKKSKSGTYVHKFKKPFEYEGVKYTTLNFYFDKLTGKDAIAVEADVNAEGKFVVAQEINIDSMCKLAARAANIFSDAIEAMPLGDFNKIIAATRSFLLGAE